MTEQESSFERVLSRCFDGESRRVRSLAAALYLILALLLLMQLGNPGSLQRIAIQPLGSTLLALPCLFLSSYAVLVVGDSLLGRYRSECAPGLGDALLHASVGAIGLGALFGAGLWSQRTAAFSVGGAGLTLLGAGLFHGARALRATEQSDEFATRRGRASRVRGRVVRSAVFATLGSLAFVVAVGDLTESSFDAQAGLVGLLVVGLGTLAFASYAAHLLWSLGADDRHWMP
ncbi:MAG: hypothetical protein AMXMBFR56_73990 [Polyangiaceae bacterium]